MRAKQLFQRMFPTRSRRPGKRRNDRAFAKLKFEVMEERLCLCAVYWTSGTSSEPSKVNRYDACAANASIETILTDPAAADSGFRYFSAVAVDQENGHLYTADGQYVFRTDLEGRNRVNLVELPFDRIAFFSVTDLAIDVTNQKIYYMNAGLRLWEADLTGANNRQLVEYSHSGSVWSFGVDVDPEGGQVFFGDNNSGNNYLLQLVDVIGGGPSTVIDFGTSAHASGVEIDPIGRRLYWSDNINGSLHTANLDGNGATAIISGVVLPGSPALAFDPVNQKLYYPEGQSIYRINPDGTDREFVVDTGTFIRYLEVAPEAAATDITATDLAIDNGRVHFAWDVDEIDLPDDSSVALFWSTDTTYDASDTLAFSRDITDFNRAVGSYSDSFQFSDLQGSLSNYLLLVVDPNDLIQEKDEANNVFALTIADSREPIFRFDFGPSLECQVAEGYIPVQGIQHTANADFGWSSPQRSFDRETPSSLLRDGDWGVDGTFVVGVPDGDYFLKLRIGDSSFARDQIDIFAEGDLIWGSVSTLAGQFVHRVRPVTVSDGRLTLRLRDSGGDPYFVINSLEIFTGSNSLSLEGPTGDLPADGMSIDTLMITGATPNALVTVEPQRGAVTTMDADANYAGVQLRADAQGEITFGLRRSTAPGPVAIYAEEVEGSAVGSTTLQFVPPALMRFDFDGADNDTQAGFISVRGNQVFSANVGFGFTTPGFEFQRDGAGISEASPSLYRDGHWGGQNFGDRTFRVAVKAAVDYDVRVYTGDRDFARDLVQVSVENGAAFGVSVSTAANGFATIALSGVSDQNNDGILDLTFSDGGGDPFWVVNGLEISEVSVGLLASSGASNEPLTNSTEPVSVGLGLPAMSREEQLLPSMVGPSDENLDALLSDRDFHAKHEYVAAQLPWERFDSRVLDEITARHDRHEVFLTELDDLFAMNELPSDL